MIFIEFIENTGKWAWKQFENFWAMISLLYDTVITVFSVRKWKVSGTQIVNQILFTGVDAFLLVGLIGLLCGVIISIQAMTNMPKIGVGEYFGNLMVISIIRELGPFFTSIVVIGRSGAALAAYIGNMRVHKEISALEVMGINVIEFLFLPVFIGIIISMICLNIYFDIIGIFGGLLFAKLMIDLDIAVSLSKISNALSTTDIFLSLIKCLIFSVVIAVVSCQSGLSAKNVRFVPRTVFNAVVSSMVITMIINVIFTLMFYVT